MAHARCIKRTLKLRKVSRIRHADPQIRLLSGARFRRFMYVLNLKQKCIVRIAYLLLTRP